MKPETPEQRAKRLLQMSEYGKRNREVITARKKAAREAAGGYTEEYRERGRLYMQKHRQRKDPEGFAARKEKQEKIDAGWCKKGHTPEERGKGRCCLACWVIARNKYKARHPDRVEAYRKNNLPLYRAAGHRYYANKLTATPKWANDFDDFVAYEALDLARRRYATTGIRWHLDHAVPLQSKLVCGLHVHTNFQVIPAKANISKGNRYWPDMP